MLHTIEIIIHDVIRTLQRHICCFTHLPHRQQTSPCCPVHMITSIHGIAISCPTVHFVIKIPRIIDTCTYKHLYIQFTHLIVGEEHLRETHQFIHIKDQHLIRIVTIAQQRTCRYRLLTCPTFLVLISKRESCAPHIGKLFSKSKIKHRTAQLPEIMSRHIFSQ